MWPLACGLSEVMLLMDRLRGDWDRQPLQLKKAFAAKDVALLHAACGGFIAIMECFQQSVPQADFVEAEPEIRNQLLWGCLTMTSSALWRTQFRR